MLTASISSKALPSPLPRCLDSIRVSHVREVWEVRWNDDESTGAMNFYSISSDGRVSNWFLLKNKLESEEALAKCVSSSWL